MDPLLDSVYFTSQLQFFPAAQFSQQLICSEHLQPSPDIQPQFFSLVQGQFLQPHPLFADSAADRKAQETSDIPKNSTVNNFIFLLFVLLMHQPIHKVERFPDHVHILVASTRA